MRKIKTIIGVLGLVDFDRQVNKLLKKGWLPHWETFRTEQWERIVQCIMIMEKKDG